MVLEVHLWRGKYNITGWYMTNSANFMTMCKMLVLCESSVLVSKLWYTCRRRDVQGEMFWSLVVWYSCDLEWVPSVVVCGRPLFQDVNHIGVPAKII